MQIHDSLSAVIKRAGYREFPCKGSYPLADSAFQKTIYGPKEGTNLCGLKLYFIDIAEYVFPSHFGYSATAHFYRVDGRSFTVCYSMEGEDTIAMVESFFAEAYRSLNCVPDIHNN